MTPPDPSHRTARATADRPPRRRQQHRSSRGARPKAPAAAKAAPAKSTPNRAGATPKVEPRAAGKATAPTRMAASKAAPTKPASAGKSGARSAAAKSVPAVAAARRPAAQRALPTPPRALSFVSPAIWDRLREYAVLTRQDRPIGWLLLLWPTWWGLWLAAEGFPPWGTLVIFTLGVLVMRSAGCASTTGPTAGSIRRSRARAAPAGRRPGRPREALAVFGVLIAIALGLVLLTNRQTIALAGVAALLAVVYPFLKRRTYVPQLWLGAAFGMSIPMACRR